LSEHELVVGVCLGMGYHIKRMKLVIMDWRAGHTASLGVCFCDVALHALLLFSCKEWFHFCCAFDKALTFDQSKFFRVEGAGLVCSSWGTAP
jgi:hypothetical protein